MLRTLGTRPVPKVLNIIFLDCDEASFYCAIYNRNYDELKRTLWSLSENYDDFKY
jgi:hypothetical protein